MRQYQELLAMDKVKLEFEHDALLAVAKKLSNAKLVLEVFVVS